MKNTADELRKHIRNITIEKKTLPDNTSLNDFVISKGSTALSNFLNVSEEIIIPLEPVLYQRPHELTEIENEILENSNNEENDLINNNNKSISDADALEVIQQHKLLFKGKYNHYYILGSLPQDIGSLQITLMVEDQLSRRKERSKIDLYEKESLQNYILQTADLFYQPAEQVEADLSQLTDLLEKFRDKLLEQAKIPQQNKRNYQPITTEKRQACIEFLSQPNLIDKIDKLIEQAGVVGEDNSRRMLFIIASTYKMATPLHSLIQGSSGSGKSHLINTIGQCFPPEDVLSMTRVTSKSFYHYNKDELVDKLMLIQDYDGLDEEAQYAFRELQSAGNISSSTTYKDRNGNLVSAIKNVKSHFASLLATTKAEIYYDNMSRSVIAGVDESDIQTKRIIEYQNKKLSGVIDTKEEKKAKEFLQNCMRCIKPMEVVNKYADKVSLPFEAKMLRRLNSHYQSFVKQITILHQYQREKDEQGRLIAQPEDLQIACDILFDAIMLKVDDLDSSLRQFFDRLKIHVKEIAKQNNKTHADTIFTQRDARLALNVAKATCFRHMEDLELLEYVQKVGGYANRGFKYKIVYWDNIETVRERIKKELNNQLNQLNNGI